MSVVMHSLVSLGAAAVAAALIVVLRTRRTNLHGVDRAAAARLRTFLDDLVARRIMPCNSVVIWRGSQVVFSHDVGQASCESGTPFRQDTIARFFSMTKPIVSCAVLRLVETGEIELDAPFSRYCPEWRDDAVRVHVSGGGGADETPLVTVPAARPITVRDLLTHSGGLCHPVYSKVIAARTSDT